MTLGGEQYVDFWLANAPVPEANLDYFRHAANLWIVDRERPEGEPILPPLAVHPFSRMGRLFAMLLGGMLMAFGSFAVAWLGGSSAGIAPLLLMALAVALCLRGLTVLASRTRADRAALGERRTNLLTSRLKRG